MKSTKKEDELRVDRRIRVPEVLVIDAAGQKLGVMPTREAQRLAKEQELNLVEVAPNSRPPVCRILDYGKYKYDLQQAAKKKKKNQVVVEIKEVKFRPKIDDHDFDFKVRHVARFLGEGDKVKCTIMFRGREMAHPQIGEAVLQRVLQHFEGKLTIEQPPRMEGRNMHMQIAQKPGAWPKKERPAVADDDKETRDKADLSEEKGDRLADPEADAPGTHDAEANGELEVKA